MTKETKKTNEVRKRLRKEAADRKKKYLQDLPKYEAITPEAVNFRKEARKKKPQREHARVRFEKRKEEKAKERAQLRKNRESSSTISSIIQG